MFRIIRRIALAGIVLSLCVTSWAQVPENRWDAIWKVDQPNRVSHGWANIGVSGKHLRVDWENEGLTAHFIPPMPGSERSNLCLPTEQKKLLLANTGTLMRLAIKDKLVASYEDLVAQLNKARTEEEITTAVWAEFYACTTKGDFRHGLLCVDVDITQDVSVFEACTYLTEIQQIDAKPGKMIAEGGRYQVLPRSVVFQWDTVLEPVAFEAAYMDHPACTSAKLKTMLKAETDEESLALIGTRLFKFDDLRQKLYQQQGESGRAWSAFYRCNTDDLNLIGLWCIAPEPEDESPPHYLSCTTTRGSIVAAPLTSQSQPDNDQG